MSANSPLATPPLSSRSPGGRVTVRVIGSTATSSQRRSGWAGRGGAAGRAARLVWRSTRRAAGRCGSPPPRSRGTSVGSMSPSVRSAASIAACTKQAMIALTRTCSAGFAFRAQLARGVEAGERVVPLLEPVPHRLEVAVRRDHGHLAAEAREADAASPDHRTAHDCEVVTGLSWLDDWPDVLSVVATRSRSGRGRLRGLRRATPGRARRRAGR